MVSLARSVVYILFALVLAACSGIQVSQDYDQSFDFSQLKTYTWKPNKDNEWGLQGNDIVDRRIREAITSNLKLRQFRQVDDNADFYVSYHVTVEQKISTSNVSGGISMGRGSRGRYGSVGISTGTEVRAYDQGTLLIDVTDPGSDKLVWRGVSTQTVSEHSDPEKSTNQINVTVEKVLAQFPPQSK